MAKGKILVFGGTGPAGICLLRELLFREHETIAFARNPSKIPSELAQNPLLEIIQGEISDIDALSTAISRSTAIISLLGPNTFSGFKPALYPDFYRSIFPLMRTHGVRRIFAMGTLSIPDPKDAFSLARLALVGLVRVVAGAAYRSIIGVGEVFAKEAGEDVDWTVFRIAGIPGGSDEASWKADREDGEVFEGYAGEKGWTLSQRRGALARWLVDAVEDGKEKWIGKMPLVSRYGGSGKRV
ncbi:hypothetical protein B0T16DRAFT_392320 [Cercophora newfieldiana]|uniref:NAD(P)-binding domain-containing protein n=1 Tax=Cercophora newfieldiana TaxID=92897 RepID=A0AA39Y0Q5_9PEZI|nr:hypothetical protein B0T16DRAFT_392320 [Cercophora newfieldiana]